MKLVFVFYIQAASSRQPGSTHASQSLQELLVSHSKNIEGRARVVFRRWDEISIGIQTAWYHFQAASQPLPEFLFFCARGRVSLKFNTEHK